MTRVAVIGASGFVGGAVVRALADRSIQVTMVQAPRLVTSARTLDALSKALDSVHVRREIASLQALIVDHDVVVNAAGVADASGGGNVLFGANALLPAVVAHAAPTRARVLHVSSAAVQGNQRVLDESTLTRPFSPYSSSKALGEAMVAQARRDAISYRPTSVHGPGRRVTARLVALLRSPAASIASGDRPTPQSLVQNVGDAVAYLSLCPDSPPAVVLHPWEGLTTRTLGEVLGVRRPTVLPAWLCHTLLRVGYLVGRGVPAVAPQVRRAEMLWFGQEQSGSWLEGRWAPPAGREEWKVLAQ